MRVPTPTPQWKEAGAAGGSTYPPLQLKETGGAGVELGRRWSAGAPPRPPRAKVVGGVVEVEVESRCG